MFFVQVMIMAKNRHNDRQEPPATSVREEVVQDSHHSAAEVTKLKEMLKQRDNEISILWYGAASNYIPAKQNS